MRVHLGVSSDDVNEIGLPPGGGAIRSTRKKVSPRSRIRVERAVQRSLIGQLAAQPRPAIGQVAEGEALEPAQPARIQFFFDFDLVAIHGCASACSDALVIHLPRAGRHLPKVREEVRLCA